MPSVFLSNIHNLIRLQTCIQHSQQFLHTNGLGQVSVHAAVQGLPAVLIKGISNPFFNKMIKIFEEEIQKKKYSKKQIRAVAPDFFPRSR